MPEGLGEEALALAELGHEGLAPRRHLVAPALGGRDPLQQVVVVEGQPLAVGLGRRRPLAKRGEPALGLGGAGQRRFAAGPGLGEPLTPPQPGRAQARSRGPAMSGRPPAVVR